MLFPDVITASAPPIWWLPIPKATDTLQPKMIDMFLLDGTRYGLQPCSRALFYNFTLALEEIEMEEGLAG